MALAAPLAGNTDIGMNGQPSPEFGAAPSMREADSPTLPLSLETTAQERWRAGDLAQVTELRRRALRIALASFGPEAPATAQAITALAQAHIDRRRWLDAEQLLILAARMPGEADENGSEVAIFAGLARVTLARGDADAALAWASRAVESARRNPQHASTEPLRAFGAALAALQRFEEARQALDAAVASDRLRHGPEAAETARSLSQLGNLHLRWNRPDDALPLLQEAAAIDQMRLGPGHPFIADDLHDLGLTYEALNRPEQARRMFAAALAGLARGRGNETSRDTPRAAYTGIALGRIHRKLGDAAAAAAAERDARRILDEAEAEERRRERRA
jgi:predicted negative regulator of RcsB-dependent stress response